MVRDFGSYCDEFGSPKDPHRKFMGIAGLLGWLDNWRRLTEEWEECLRAEDIPKPFHMVDFVHHNEKFSAKRWEDRDERNRALDLLLSIIKRAEVIPIGAAIVLKDYYGLTPEQQELCRHTSNIDRGPYYLAFQAVTANIAFAAASIDLSLGIERARVDVEREKAGLPLEEYDHLSPASVSMVYAKLRKFTGPAEELWNAMKALNMIGRWMGSYTAADPADYPPLQAADIWAYSLGHMGEEGNKVESQTALRIFIGLAMKATHGHHWFTYLDRNQILINIGQLPNEETIRS
jgi:Protein of unknown function (DUF3800)